MALKELAISFTTNNAIVGPEILVGVLSELKDAAELDHSEKLLYGTRILAVVAENPESATSVIQDVIGLLVNLLNYRLEKPEDECGILVRLNSTAALANFSMDTRVADAIVKAQGLPLLVTLASLPSQISNSTLFNATTVTALSPVGISSDHVKDNAMTALRNISVNEKYKKIITGLGIDKTLLKSIATSRSFSLGKMKLKKPKPAVMDVISNSGGNSPGIPNSNSTNTTATTITASTTLLEQKGNSNSTGSLAIPPEKLTDDSEIPNESEDPELSIRERSLAASATPGKFSSEETKQRLRKERQYPLMWRHSMPGPRGLRNLAKQKAAREKAKRTPSSSSKGKSRKKNAGNSSSQPSEHSEKKFEIKAEQPSFLRELLEQSLPYDEFLPSDDDSDDDEKSKVHKKSGVKPNHPARRGTGGTTNGVRYARGKNLARHNSFLSWALWEEERKQKARDDKSRDKDEKKEEKKEDKRESVREVFKGKDSPLFKEGKKVSQSKLEKARRNSKKKIIDPLTLSEARKKPSEDEEDRNEIAKDDEGDEEEKVGRESPKEILRDKISKITSVMDIGDSTADSSSGEEELSVVKRDERSSRRASAKRKTYSSSPKRASTSRLRQMESLMSAKSRQGRESSRDVGFDESTKDSTRGSKSSASARDDISRERKPSRGKPSGTNSTSSTPIKRKLSGEKTNLTKSRDKSTAAVKAEAAFMINTNATNSPNQTPTNGGKKSPSRTINLVSSPTPEARKTTKSREKEAKQSKKKKEITVKCMWHADKRYIYVPHNVKLDDLLNALEREYERRPTIMKFRDSYKDLITISKPSDLSLCFAQNPIVIYIFDTHLQSTKFEDVASSLPPDLLNSAAKNLSPPECPPPKEPPRDDSPRRQTVRPEGPAVSELKKSRAEMSLKQLKKYPWIIPYQHLDLSDAACLGRGFFGEVRKGKWRGGDVACKIIYRTSFRDKTDEEMFIREVNVLSKLRHPRVILFMGACLDTDDKIIVTEYMVNGSLNDQLHNPDVKMSYSTIVNIAMDIALGMNYLHGENILHRDLNCKNILMTENYRAKVADFGLSRTKYQDASISNTMGAVAWMAPEIIVDASQFTTKADVYSYGVVLWEILSRGTPVPSGISAIQMAKKIETEDYRPPIPEDCPRKWLQLMTTSWSRNPAQRPTFGEILDIFIPRLQKESQELLLDSSNKSKSDDSDSDDDENGNHNTTVSTTQNSTSNSSGTVRSRASFSNSNKSAKIVPRRGKSVSVCAKTKSSIISNDNIKGKKRASTNDIDDDYADVVAIDSDNNNNNKNNNNNNNDNDDERSSSSKDKQTDQEIAKDSSDDVENEHNDDDEDNDDDTDEEKPSADSSQSDSPPITPSASVGPFQSPKSKIPPVKSSPKLTSSSPTFVSPKNRTSTSTEIPNSPPSSDSVKQSITSPGSYKVGSNAKNIPGKIVINAAPRSITTASTSPYLTTSTVTNSPIKPSILAIQQQLQQALPQPPSSPPLKPRKSVTNMNAILTNVNGSNNNNNNNNNNSNNNNNNEEDNSNNTNGITSSTNFQTTGRTSAGKLRTPATIPMKSTTHVSVSSTTTTVTSTTAATTTKFPKIPPKSKAPLDSDTNNNNNNISNNTNNNTNTSNSTNTKGKNSNVIVVQKKGRGVDAPVSDDYIDNEVVDS